MIDNKQHLCGHGFLHPMTARKGKYIPENVYTSMKDIYNKHLKSESVLGFDSSEEITHLNNHDISYKNMRCGDCIKELWDDMSRKIIIPKELHALVKALKINFKVPEKGKFGVLKIHNKIDRLFLCNNRFGYHIIWKRTLIYTTERKMSIDKMFWSHVH